MALSLEKIPTFFNSGFFLNFQRHRPIYHSGQRRRNLRLGRVRPVFFAVYHVPVNFRVECAANFSGSPENSIVVFAGLTPDT